MLILTFKAKNIFLSENLRRNFLFFYIS